MSLASASGPAEAEDGADDARGDDADGVPFRGAEDVEDAGGFSEASTAALTFARTTEKSGRAGLMSGGTNWTLLIFSDFAFAARSRKVPSWPAGMSVLTTCLPAAAMSWNLARTVPGSSWWSIASITHRCRAMRA